MRHLLVALAVLAHTPSPSAQFQVWTVDDDGPADFPDLQLAIDAAADGDALLIRGGLYDPAILSAKRLTFLAEDGETITASGAPIIGPALVSIDSLASSQPVLFVGVSLDGGANRDGIGVSDSQGLVWLQSTSVSGRGGIAANNGSLVVRQSTASGNVTSGSVFFIHNGAGADLIEATLLAYGSSLVGAMGSNAGCIIGFSCGNGSVGGEGISADFGSHAFLSGVDVKGGNGEASICDSTSWGEAGSGGAGIVVSGDSQVTAIASTFTEGFPGQSFTVCPDGEPGVAMSPPLSVDLSPEPRRSLAITDLVREGEPIDLTVEGPPGETILVGLAVTPAVAEDPQIEGPLILGNLLSVTHFGPLPASGVLPLSFSAGNLPPSIEFLSFYLQPVFVTAGGERHAGDPMAITILSDEV